MTNVNIFDNGAGFCVTVNGLIVEAKSTLGGAWKHIQWMYEVASQEFTVGDTKIHVRDWLDSMKKAGYLD